MSRYSEEQMSGSARHTYSEPTEQERALMAMSTTQREELIDRMRYDAARATHLEKEARMKAQIAAATEVSLAGNHWYQAQQRGQLSQRVSVTNGQTTVEQLNAKAPPSNSSAFAVPPRALVDSLRVTIGGIQLGPKQARQMAEDGEISMEDYGEAVARAVAPYGYGSFPISSTVQEQPRGDNPEVAVEHDADDDAGDDLTPEQKAEKTHQELSDGADRALNRWAEAQPVEVQQAVVDTFAETGVIDFEAAGVDQLEAQVVEAAFTQRLVRSVLAPLGLTLESWSEHIDEAELPEFRRAVVRGDWALLTRHAQAAAKMRLDLGI